MKFTIIILSVVSITTAVRVTSIWPLSGNNFQNVFSGENRPVRQNEPFTPTNPVFLPNRINENGNNIPNIRTANLDVNNKQLLNLPGGNNDWVPLMHPATGYIQNVANGNNGFGFPEPINNIPQFGDANGRKKPYLQQKQGPPKFIQKVAKFNGSPAYNNQRTTLDKSVPEQNHLQYITYTTQLPISQFNAQGADFSTIHPVENLDLTQKPGQNQIQYITYTTQLPGAQLKAQEAAYSTIDSVENFDSVHKDPQTLNMKQAYPKVSSPNTAIPLVELDFNPKNPFPRYHQRGAVLDKTLVPQVPPLKHGASLQSPQATGRFDFNLNNPFPQHQFGGKTLNGHQASQVPRLPHGHSHRSIPHSVINKQSNIGTKLPLANLDFDPRNPFTKNYRDDRTHEPGFDPHFDREPVPKVERLESEKAPVTYHEHPAEVPTKPIYPGEGKWAKQGVKHKPFISKHKFATLEDSKEKPDGYDTFLEAQQLFEGQQNQFGKKLQEFPQKHQLDTSKNTHQRVRQEKEETEEDEQDGDGEPFVPTRLYAQVRHSEDEKHLPAESDENGRLKELIKDSKIQTIYSEEGYEDSAYDHAGHEKNAENVEGLEEDGKKLETDEKKKDPAKKYNLHLPQRQSTSYSKEGLKEDDSEKLKKEELKLDDDDSVSAGTNYEYLNKLKPPKKIFSAKTRSSNKKPNMQLDNSFVESEEPKTTTSARGNGNTEMEISSEVKLVLQPNNSTKSHKYVKIYPKTYKTLQTNDKLKQNKKSGSDKVDGVKIYQNNSKVGTNRNTNGIFIEEVSDKVENTTGAFTTAAPTEYTEIFTVEIPTTTQATTAIPKVTARTLDLPKDDNSEVLENTDQEFLKISTNKRKKRDAIDFPEVPVEIDTDFIDNIDHKLGKPQKPKDLTKSKYPYYHSYKEKGLHENSPLRYSESLKNIPIKTESALAFYDQANKKIECPEVDPSVDPVPDRVKNAEENEEEEDAPDAEETAKSPRLGQLGDKIDCLKVRYFGENPLDSPFFQEQLVGPIKPIFKEIEGSTTKIVRNQSKNEKRSDVEPRNSRKIKRADLKVVRDTIEIAEPIPSASGYEKENEIEDSVFEKYFGKKFHPSKFFSRNSKGDAIEKIQKFVKKYLDKNDSQESKKKTLTKNENFNNPTEDNKLGFNIFTDVAGNMKSPKDDVENIKIADKLISAEISKEVRTLPPATLITTPMYTINLKPRHIYDQIELLEYLPPEENLYLKKEVVKDIPNKTTKENLKDFPKVKKLAMNMEIPDVKQLEMKTNIPENLNDLPNVKKLENNIKTPDVTNLEMKITIPEIKKMKIFKHDTERQAKVLQNREETIENFDDDISESPPEADSLKRRRRTKPKRPLYQIFDINKYLPKVPKVSFPTASSKPFTQDFVTNSNFFYATRAPAIQIFDINKYLPTTPFPLFQGVAASTVLPKYKVLSEVFYKDEIKPNEQLNVFNDVLNNIRNFPQAHQDNFLSASNSISVKLPTTTASTVATIKPTIPSQVQQNSPSNHQTHSASSAREKYFETKSKRKRQRTKTTTQKVPEVVEETTPLEEGISEEPMEVMGLMPPVSHRYKTIYNPKRDNSLHESDYTTTEERKLNKYLVPGMKPPPKQRVYLYSDYLTNNHIRSRIGKPKRSKRSANRPAYAQVTRNRNKQQEVTEKVEEKKDDDDYVPHRPRNYHYDEHTGKIVYDKKPEIKQEESEEEEEVVYIEVEEEKPKPTEKPKQNPIFATATPPPAGQSYVDFVNILKSASNYKAIPDPTTTEKGIETTTANIVTTTIKPVSTTPPEFLSILAKVRSDEKYKLIEDKKKAKITTTTEAVEEVEEEVEEESQVENIRNSPGRHSLGEGTNLELFDIVDFLPNVKSYLPKTPVDTSKYKSIQRPTLRHNLSSRYSSDEDKDLQNINTSKKPLLSNTDDTSKIPVTSESKIAGETQDEKTANSGTYPSTVSTTTPAAATAQPQSPKIRTPNRRRTTAPRSTATTQEGVTTTPSSVTATNSEAPQNDKARRNYRRKSPRIKLRSTTEKTIEQETDNTTEIVRRRLERDSGVPEPLDSIDEENTDYEESESRNYGKENPDIVVRGEKLNTTNVNPLFDLDKITKKVEIISDYDKTRKHGGNYRSEYQDIGNSESSQDENFPKLNQDEKNVREFVAILNTYDKTKKHGGNYKSENKDTIQPRSQEIIDSKSNESNKNKNVDVFKSYDHSMKNGGNYRSEIEDNAQIVNKPVTDPEKNIANKNKEVNVYKTYDPTKKHGGNYRSENGDVVQIKEQVVVDTETNKPKNIDNVNTFKIYDPTKKDDGNYRPENEAILQVNEQEIIKPGDAETFKAYDPSKKHGGNYRSENKDLVPIKEQALINPEVEEAKNKVNTFAPYDHSKKHDVNYRSENEDIVQINRQAGPDTKESKKIENIETFKSYNPSKRHDGNYRSENEDKVPINKKTLINSEEKELKNVEKVNVFKAYDHTKKHGGNYRSANQDVPIKEQVIIDPEAKVKSIEEVDIFKAYDHIKKHGGNYRSENENIPIKEYAVLNTDTQKLKNIEDVNTFKTYDHTKKHSGTYKSEKKNIPIIEVIIDPLSKVKNTEQVDTYKAYDHTKKHGGNYRSENEDVPIKEQQYKESQVVQPKEILNKYGLVQSGRTNNDIDVYKQYDKSNKHGGNDKSENDDVAEEEREAVTEANNTQTKVNSNPDGNKINDIEIFNNFDKNKKHGGNYKRENKEKEQSVEETQFDKVRIPNRKPQKKHNYKDVQRLADIILKPESFYTDVQLPIAINELNIVNDLSTEELEEIVASVEEEQLNGGFGNRENSKTELDNNSISAEPSRDTKVIPTEIEQALTTKKPFFIKDPSKRLYFYAPLR